MPVMTVGEIDREIDVLHEHAYAWARLGFAATIRHLRAMRARTVEVATAWVEAAARAKGIAGTPLAGEEWFSGPYPLLSALDRLATTLGEIARRGTPAIPETAIWTRPNGQVVVAVFPVLSSERILVSGVRAEMWMEPDVTVETALEGSAAAHRHSDRAGRVTLVLGAGNIASIPPLDVLTVLFSQRSVAILKLSPVNAYLEPIFTRVFGALIEEGFVRIAEGGADLGAYLAAHPGIDAIHLTGSTRTRDAIAAAAPRKTLTCELGNVTPVIVVPGPWSDPDLVFQAAHIATQKLQNTGANCTAAQLLVTPAEWERAPALLARVRAALAGAPARPAYYPGTAQRVADALAEHRDAEILATEPDGVPRVFAANLDPRDRGEPLFHAEVFGPVLAQTALPGRDPATFLRNAVAFVNERLRGSLAVSILIHPRTIAELGAAFDEAIAALRYGCVAINAWPGVGFALATASWGAYPDDAGDEAGSGNGVVHNAFLFDRPQKTIVRAPFAPFPRSLGDGERSLLPTPPWFVTHRRADVVGRRLFAFTAQPSGPGMGATMLAAIRG
jgi:aldehyde dehydrogenase (NAD(P)+)